MVPSISRYAMRYFHLTVIISSALLVACGGESSRAPVTPSAIVSTPQAAREPGVTPSAVTATSSESGPSLLAYASPGTSGRLVINFPPRNEPNAFFSDLQALYRDVLGRTQTTTYVDPEGQNVWLTEYFRFYLNGCSHEESVARTLREITQGGSQPVCGAENPNFPPRDLPFAFQNQLEATYRDTLRRTQVLSYVDSEGANVWLAQYLRFRITSCDHQTAQNKVFLEIRGGGVQPPCQTGPRTTFGPGQYRVNIDIAPGRYYADPVSGCYWERQRGFGGTLSDIISNEFIGFNAGQWIVDILPSDVGFQTDSECGTWFNTPRPGPGAVISPGMWLVGSQVAAGTYTAATRAGCYWQRLRDFTGNLSGIIANEFVANGGTRFVSIGGGDAGFSADDQCGQWTRSSSDYQADAGLDVEGRQSAYEIEENWMMNRQETEHKRPRR